MTHQLKTSKMSTKVISTFVALYLVFNVEGVENDPQPGSPGAPDKPVVDPVPTEPEIPAIPQLLPAHAKYPPGLPNPSEHHHHHHYNRPRPRRRPVVITQYDIRDKLRLNNAMGQIMQLRSLVILLVYGYLMMNVLKKNDLGEKVFITLVSAYLIFFF